MPERVAVWAAAVKDDVDTPDLWAELQREREVLTGARYEGVENTPFTADERAEVARQLQEIKEYVTSTYSPTEGQILSLVARLDYVEEAAGRLGRKDWLLLFYGTMFGLIVDSLLMPEAVRNIIKITFHGLVHLFGGGTPPQLPS